MKLLATALTCSAILAAQPVLALQTLSRATVPTGKVAPVFSGTIDGQTGQLITSAPGTALGAAPLGDPIYRNDTFSGEFEALGPGDILIDEGRIPSTSSTDVVGTQDSYTLSSLQFGYATDALSTMAGGTDVGFRLSIFDRYDGCADLDVTDAPIYTLDFTAPASDTGTLVTRVIDISLSGAGVCIRGDGDGVYSMGRDDLFGFSVEVINPGVGATLGTGPLYSGDPLAATPGDGTVFQSPLATSGSGLTSQDFLRAIMPAMSQCQNLGGYPANDFASLWFVVRSDLAGDCIGCGIGDDRFEENDTPATATPVEFESYSGLICDGEDDWYSLTLAGGEEVQIDIAFSTFTADLDLYLFDAGSMTELARGFTGTNDETVLYRNCGPTPINLAFQIDSFSANCNTYDLAISDPALFDDALENNDSCFTAVPLPIGVSRDLVVRESCATDNDFYAVSLAAGETVTVDILYDNITSDINLALFDTTTGCPGTLLVDSNGLDGSEHVDFTNTGSMPMDVVVEVRLLFGDRALYDMIGKVTPAATVGELICIGNDNSTGSGATVCAIGSETATDNDVRLDVAGLPPGQFGFFVVSKEANFANPAASQGTLCIASLSIGRYSDDILMADAGGMFSFTLDLTQIPFSAGGTSFAIAAMAGDTINYQAWYRDFDDMGDNTSNFSDAISITFE